MYRYSMIKRESTLKHHTLPTHQLVWYTFNCQYDESDFYHRREPLSNHVFTKFSDDEPNVVTADDNGK